jgi:SAM-dependent methyltransferase
LIRLHWGCGERPRPGWINSDKIQRPGIDLPADIRRGLPLRTDSVAYIVSIHALQEIPYLELDGVVRELRRVLEPGGVLRLGLPDLERGIKAYVERDPAYFYIKDDESATLGGKFAIQLTWYGSSRIMFDWDYIHEVLTRGGFREVRRCGLGQTASRYPEIVELDDRPRETLFVEAVK